MPCFRLPSRDALTSLRWALALENAGIPVLFLQHMPSKVSAAVPAAVRFPYVRLAKQATTPMKRVENQCSVSHIRGVPELATFRWLAAQPDFRRHQLWTECHVVSG